MSCVLYSADGLLCSENCPSSSTTRRKCCELRPRQVSTNANVHFCGPRHAPFKRQISQGNCLLSRCARDPPPPPCGRRDHSGMLENGHSGPVCLHLINRCFMPDRRYRARQALSLLLVPSSDKHGSPVPAIEFFDQQEIYPGSYVGIGHLSVHFVSRCGG